VHFRHISNLPRGSGELLKHCLNAGGCQLLQQSATNRDGFGLLIDPPFP
jgi:hypothetical protein